MKHWWQLAGIVVVGALVGISYSRWAHPPLPSHPTNAHPVWVTNVNGTKVWSD